MERGRYVCCLLAFLALLFAAGSCRRGESTGTAVKDINNIDTLLKRGGDSLLAERNGFALEAVRRGREIARDSDEYYMTEVLRSKYYFKLMNADSFLSINRRLAAYLAGNAGNMNHRRRMLAVNERLQRGAYLSQMAGLPDSALACYVEALRLIERNGSGMDTKLLALCNLADVYKQLGRYAECVYYYKWGSECADSIGAPHMTRVAFTLGIASAYTAMHDFTQSGAWWDKARQLYPGMSMKDKFIFLNNRGNDYYLQQRYVESRRCFEKLDTLLAGRKEYEWERMFGHTNLADVYLKLGYTDRTQRLIDEVEPFFRKQGFALALFYIDTQKIELRLKLGDVAGALRTAGEAGIPESMIPEQKMMRLEVMEKLCELTGDFPGYVEASTRRHALSDSLAGNNMKMRFSEKLMQYERDARLLEQQRTIAEKEKTVAWAVGSLIGVVVVTLLVIVVFSLHRRHLKLREAEMLNQIMALRIRNTRSLISPHFIYNALSHEMLAQMEGRKVNLDILVQLLRRGNQMADVLCTTLREELEFIDYYLEIENRSVAGGIVFWKEVEEGIDTSAVRLPSMTVQIFVENALKHGVRGRKTGGMRIWIRVAAERHGTVIEVMNNGSGTGAHCAGGEGGEYGTGMIVVSRTVELFNAQNRMKMDFGTGCVELADGSPGYRSWLYVPDGFEYELKGNIKVRNGKQETRHGIYSG